MSTLTVIFFIPVTTILQNKQQTKITTKKLFSHNNNSTQLLSIVEHYRVNVVVWLAMSVLLVAVVVASSVSTEICRFFRFFSFGFC
jgi:hypothetical protein